MRAAIRSVYGSPDDLELGDVPVPTVEDDSVLVRVRAASVNAVDWHRLRGLPYLVRLSDGLRRPRENRLGVDVAGVVEAVGGAVTTLRPGDEVFGAGSGAFADYVVGRERSFVVKPRTMTYIEAAAVPVAGTTALQAVRDKGRLQPGQSVLVNGASGGVGTFAVQIAKALGAEVTGVCSTRNLDLVRSIGADHTVDHTRRDFTQTGTRHDLVIDVAASRPLSQTRRALQPDGTLVLVGAPSGSWVAPVSQAVQALVLSPLGRQRLLPMLSQVTHADLLTLKELMDEGKVTPVVDRTYPLSDIAAALRYVESGHARGKVVITL